MNMYQSAELKLQRDTKCMNGQLKYLQSKRKKKIIAIDYHWNSMPPPHHVYVQYNN